MEENHLLDGVRVIEVAGVEAEYVGLVLAGLGAEVIKVEPPSGSPTRQFGPFADDMAGLDRSLHFWAYNRGKQSIVLDLERGSEDREIFTQLLSGADVLLDGTAREFLSSCGLGREKLLGMFPGLVICRMTAFGDTGPWADFKGSDLVHLALGGEMMNCGYSPRLDGSYDLPPIAGQAWHAYHIAGEQLAFATVAALYYRSCTGEGQIVSCAIHEAVAKNTEIDVSSWIYRRAPVTRQTCQHAAEQMAKVPPIIHTKDGRWFLLSASRSRENFEKFLAQYGAGQDFDGTLEIDASAVPGRSIPGTGNVSDQDIAMIERMQRLFWRFTYEEAPWKEAQEAGILISPIRRPEENADDEHWAKRETFSEIEHPELGRKFIYVTSKWLSTETSWKRGRRAPLLNEDATEIKAQLARQISRSAGARAVGSAESPKGMSRRMKPFALDGVRIFDFSWFLASAGGTRFLAAMGAEVIKVEWAAHPDTRLGVMAPEGGRSARERATGPLPGVSDPNQGGQFNNKNSGKRGISLNVRHPEGMAIARKLIGMSDVVAEGFSPGVLHRWGLGYDELRRIKPDIIYAQQSGMGQQGTYGRFRAVGVIAASLAGVTDMAGLAEPTTPAGWGYSYLDWIGAYSFGLAIMSALVYRQRTGKGQWIDASQTESGIFIEGIPVLDYSVNRRRWQRQGNRSPWGRSAPQGAYPCVGADRWIAIECTTEAHWQALARIAGHEEWLTDTRFSSHERRLAHQDDLDGLIAGWTRGNDRYELMYALQRSGIPAGVCQTAEDRVDFDPQLKELQWLTEVSGTRIGTWPIPELPFKMSATPPYIGGPIDRSAPCYGEDNEYVYGELLGMETKDIARLAQDGVI